MISNGEPQVKKKRRRRNTSTPATGKRTRRPRSNTDAIARRICQNNAPGNSLDSICRRKGAPGYSTVTGWLIANKEFATRYAYAREAAADVLADEIIELADTAKNDGVDPNAVRVAVDARKWVASKLKPRVYGDHSQVDVKGALDMGSRNLVDSAPQWIKDRISKTSSPDQGAQTGAGIAAGIAAANISKTKH